MSLLLINAAKKIKNVKKLNKQQRANYSKTSLQEPWPGVQEQTGAVQAPANVESKKLSNGVTVVSFNLPSPTTSMSLFIHAGTRFETGANAGVGHFLKRYAFKNTHKKYNLQLIRDVDIRGTEYSVVLGRDNIAYNLTGLRTHQDNMAETLGAVFEPYIEEYLVDRVRRDIREEIADVQSDPQVALMEALHRDAFRDQPLGQGIFCPSYNLEKISDVDLRQFVSQNFKLDRMVVVGTGTDLNTLAGLVEKNFTVTDIGKKIRDRAGEEVEKYIMSNLNPPLPPQPAPLPTKYIGGAETRLPGGGPTQIAIAFEGVGANKGPAAVAAAAALQFVLGGGNSHMRGILPGFGRHSKIGKIIDSNAWATQGHAFHLSYKDGGLFGVIAEAQRGHAKDLTNLVYQQIKSIEKVTDAELNVAKAQLKASILSNLESNRENLNEFLVAQVQGGSSAPITPLAYAKLIDELTSADVANAAKTILSSKPTVAAVGDVYGIPKL